MNENVIIKTPKRRRWIARLLVSALCILLASSLLFVGVVAENIELVAQYCSDYVLASTPSEGYVYPFGADFLVYSNSYQVYLQKGSVVKSVFDIRSSSGYDSAYDGTNISFYYDGSVLYGLTTKVNSSSFSVSLYTFSVVDDEIVSASAVNSSTSDFTGTFYSTFATFVVVDGNVYSFYFTRASSSSSVLYLRFFKLSNSNLTVFTYGSIGTGFNAYRSSVSFQDGNVLLGIYKNSRVHIFNIYSNTFSYVEPGSFSTTKQNYIFDYEGDTYYVNSNVLRIWNSDTLSFDFVGYGVSGVYFCAYNGVLISYSLPASMSIPYTVYEGLPVTEPPPESSDETTTEPPPESSEGSSADPSGGTKIWGSILNADGSYTSSLLGTLDLSQATEVRAYIGSWTSKDSSFQSETPVPLTFYVYNSEDGPPDIYTFDYHAAGYSLLGDSVSDFTFPDVIGQFFTLPYNGETDLYFPNVAPYGTVLVSTPFGDSFGGRVMLNLVSADSYFRLDFVDEDTFAVVIFNTAGPGSRTNFDLDIRAYREGYRLEDGETSSSRWFYPSFGSSASYTAEYVTESGLYLVFVDSFEDTVYPWEDGTWSDVIGDANSRLEDVSVNHALLESLANDAFGKYSFDPMTNQNFIGAVSEFNDIRDSSGGNYILRYIWGMWNIHPFASSMIAIVGTLAIVGFIIRKM